MAKFLDKAGVQTLWNKMKSYVDNKDADTSKIKIASKTGLVEPSVYIKLATFSKSDDNNATCLIVQGALGGYPAFEMANVSLVFGNRYGFNATGIVTSQNLDTTLGKVDLVAYIETDGTHTLYLKVANWFRYSLFVTSFEQVSFDYSGEFILSPTGSEDWRLSSKIGTSGIITS